MKHAESPTRRLLFFRALLIAVCAVIIVPSMPVNYFTITGRGRTLFTSPVPNGYQFLTTYTHSLERTPVVDDYRFVGGRMNGPRHSTPGFRPSPRNTPHS